MSETTGALLVGLSLGLIIGAIFGHDLGTNYGWETYHKGVVECVAVFEATECRLKEE